MAYIYKITNKINNKVYIGQTNLTTEVRFKKHLKSWKSNDCPKLYRAFRKYGKENFICETICETNNPNDDEKYWIEYYNSVNQGYNVSYGGYGGTILGKDIEKNIIDLYKHGESIRSIHRNTNLSRDYIRTCLIKYDLYNVKEQKYINYIDIISNYKELKEIKLVAQKMNISEKTIRKYLQNNNIEIYNHKNDRYIYVAYDIHTMKEIKRFDNRQEIEHFLNSSNKDILSCINKVINGFRKSYKGYFWKRIDKI